MKQSLDRVRIGADLTSATVDGHEITADNPKALRKALGDALYKVFHTGQDLGEEPRRLRRDPEFEQALQEVVPHRHSRSLVPVEPGSPDVVRLNGVRVRIPESELGAAVETPGGPSRWVSLPAVMPALSPGFLLVNSSTGHGLGDACVRVYLGTDTADAAPGLWGATLGRLEELRIAYRAKVLSARDHYPRRDTIVVYLGQRSWHVVPEIARAAAAGGGLRQDVSLYVAQLDRGIGWAWEPQDPRPGMRGLSFGEHRSQAIAAGLLSHAEHGGDQDQAVAEALRAAGVVPDAVHRNLDSPPLPFETSGPEPGPGSYESRERR
ncbi:T3SS effector HopA1 family protein [Nonomuraea sp. NPDC003754]